jgi:hypothetical protein
MNFFFAVILRKKIREKKFSEKTSKKLVEKKVLELSQKKKKFRKFFGKKSLRKNFRHLFLGPIVSLIGGPRIKPNNMGSGLKTNKSKSSSMGPIILGPSKGPKRRAF